MSSSLDRTVVYGSGTMVGLVKDHQSNSRTKPDLFEIPQIVITGSSTNSLLQKLPEKATADDADDDQEAKDPEDPHEGTTLLTSGPDSSEEISPPSKRENLSKGLAEEPANNDEEFEQFVLNRTLSENNILDSSIYSELQFAPSIYGGSGQHHFYTFTEGGSRSALGMDLLSCGQQAAPQVSPHSNALAASHVNANDVLNSSICSRDSRQMRRVRRKLKTKANTTPRSANSKCSSANGSSAYPPRYTAIFMEPPHHNATNPTSAMTTNSSTTNRRASGTTATTTASGIAGPFLGGATSEGAQPQCVAMTPQDFSYYHQRPLLAMAPTPPSRIFERNIGPALTPTPVSIVTTSRFNICKWFTRPSLPFIIGIFALGGVACTLGGIVLGSTGLIEHSTQYLSAALLMIGIGVSLLVIAGAIWRISLPDDLDNCHCYRHMETCVNCNNPYCYNRMFGNGYFYPEFQFRPPPPSYLTSLNEFTTMNYIFHPGVSNQRAPDTMRINTPPPMYRSTNSLSISFNSLPQSIPGTNGHSAAPASGTALLPRNPLMKQSNLTLSTVTENIPSELAEQQSQPLTKDLNYLEMD